MAASDPFLEFFGEPGQRDVPVGPAAPRPNTPVVGYGTAPTREDTEDALHSRLNAAIIDQILLGLVIGAISLVFHVTFASLSFAAVAVAIELGYFFIEETRTGQTIGKRQYGVRVVTLDGSRPGPRAIAYRTLARLLDTLPAYYASGLITMIGTGRRRRQRIGDMIARTTVVAAPGGRALAPRRPWLLPLLTTVAIAISVGVIVRAVELADNDNLRAGFVSGCERDGAPSSYCGCLFNAIEAAGYTTTAAWEGLDREVAAARTSNDSALLPPTYVSAVQSCGTP
jgi:uncharacterized RDD family membrane protein YckC